MMLKGPALWKFLKHTKNLQRSISIFPPCEYQKVEGKYTNEEKVKILKALNTLDTDTLPNYDLTKGRIRNFTKWKRMNGTLKSLSDVEDIEGFTERNAIKFFDSVLEDGDEKKNGKGNSKVRGQVLYPALTDVIRENCNRVTAVYVTVNSVSWCSVSRPSYELQDWEYQGIEVAEGKKLQIPDILEIVWSVLGKLPEADVYVMKAPPTTLRAGGSDPNNPKVLMVNLQKSQLMAMIVALINARSRGFGSINESEEHKLTQMVYFLRATLPFRLYGTLIGNERVSTEQTVEMLLSEAAEQPSGTTKSLCVPPTLKNYFRSQKDLQKDVLGQCLLLALTFMDVCVYRNTKSIDKLTKT